MKNFIEYFKKDPISGMLILVPALIALLGIGVMIVGILF